MPSRKAGRKREEGDSPHLLSRTRACAASAARDPTVLDAKTAVHVNRTHAGLFFSGDRLAVKLALGMTIGVLSGDFVTRSCTG